jgi:CubicO group peptidase (beta-lactamase class C family)
MYCVACNHSSGEKKIEDDSLQYYPPTPITLNKDEFRYYYRALSGFFDSSLLDKGQGFNGGILIAKDGNVIYEKYVGYTDIRKKDTLNDTVSFHIASTSKTFTGIAIMRLVQENKLSLDDSITKFFPGLPYPGITVRMLLSHRSGLPNYLYYVSNSKWDKKKYATNEDVLQLLYTDQPNKTNTAGTRFNYSNTNFVLLAMIIEKVTGKSYPEYMQSKFFGPLGMKHTYVFTIKDTLSATPSFNYNGNYWDFDFLDATYGDKNIYSTPRDLLKWDQALYTGQLINPALQDSAFTGQSFEKPSVHNYGLGWRLELLPNGKKVIYHYGKWHGFNAAFARLTDEKVTIIVLGNKFTRSIYYNARRAYNLFGDYSMQSNGNADDDETEDSTRKVTPALNKIRK